MVLQGTAKRRRGRRGGVVSAVQPAELLRGRGRRVAALAALVRSVLALAARLQELGVGLVLVEQPRHAEQAPHQVRSQLLHDLGALAAAAAGAEVELAAEEGREDVELLRVRQRGQGRRGRLDGPRARRALELHRAVAGALAERAARLSRASVLVLRAVAVGSAPTLTD